MIAAHLERVLSGSTRREGGDRATLNDPEDLCGSLLCRHRSGEGVSPLWVIAIIFITTMCGQVGRSDHLPVFCRLCLYRENCAQRDAVLNP
jgi:hypothetical protein